MKTRQQKAEEQREAKLQLVRDQIANGSLVIRRMTAEERRQYPPRSPRVRRWG
jgi:hypothetical protein